MQCVVSCEKSKGSSGDMYHYAARGVTCCLGISRILPHGCKRIYVKLSIINIFWSDSQTVLGYLKNQNKRLPTFEANGVKRILSNSMSSQWWWIDTAQNL